MEAILTSQARSDSFAPSSKKRRWAGAILSGISVLFLLFDSVVKLVEIQPVVDAMDKLGFPEQTARPIGLILLACVVLYLVPRTAVLGAILLTGYFGGAIVAHLRVLDPLFSHTLFPIYVAALVWGGLYLRDPRVRTIAPWHRPERDDQ